MKKNLVMIVMLGLMLSVTGFVLADQTTIIDGDEVVDFTLTDLNFGPVVPGVEKTTTSTMTLAVANNVDFALDISLDALSDPIFENIELDLTDVGGSATGNLLIATALSASVDDVDTTDTSTEQVLDIDGKITIPVGPLPGERTATIVYTVTGTTP